jgi:hypothetical protein
MGQSPYYMRAKDAFACLWAVVLVLCAGCTSGPYQYRGDLHTECDAAIAPGESQIVRGRPAPVLDTVGWVVGVPAKIVMLDHRIDNHNVSPETEMRIHEYLACNGLDKVKVRVNQYDPWGEWKRLNHNESVGWPLRYTFGTLSVVGYTLLPGRVFGGDVYNPFTNTISIYSDVPAVAVYEGGHAKDYAQTRYKGLYALACGVPGVRVVFHDAHASSDALGYLQENGTPQDIKEGYRTVCPAYALNASGPLAAATGVPLTLPAVAAGHVVGQVKAASVHDHQPPDLPAPENQAAATAR